MGKLRDRNFLCPLPPQDGVKLFTPPVLKNGNFLRPHFNMAKTSKAKLTRYLIKTTPKLFVSPIQYC